MADTKLSELPVKSTTVNLTADIFAVVSGGVTEQVPANLIPFTKILTANTSIYIATTGNDSTGDGSVGLPYLTPHKAYEHLQDYFLGAGVIATIQCAAGTYTIASTLIPYHPQGSQVLLKGATMLGTVVDGDFVASAATTTTNLETRFATVFRGNFADNLIDSDIHGSNLIFKVEDILFDGNAVSTYGLNFDSGARLYTEGSVAFISFITTNLSLVKDSAIYDTGNFLGSSHSGSGLIGSYNCSIFINNGTFAYNAGDAVIVSDQSNMFMDGTVYVRDNTLSGIVSTQDSHIKIDSTVSASNNTTDFLAVDDSFINIATGALSSGDVVVANFRSSIRSAATAGVTFSPAHSVNGNTDSLIYA